MRCLWIRNPINRTYPEFFKKLILRAYRERASIRGIERIFGIARQTLARWISEKADALPKLATTLEKAEANDILELDKSWSFVLRKSNQRWIWIALCRRTRQVMAYFIGNRSEESCRQLWQHVPDAYKKVLSSETHQSVGKETGQTSLVERWNNTLRQRLARFVRKDLSFSKSNLFHEAVLSLYMHYYNTAWCPIS